MDMYNQFLEKVMLPVGDRVTGNCYVQKLKEYRAYDSFSKDKLQEVQRTRLHELLQYVTNHVPYYRNLNIEPETDPYKWLRKFPLLRKPDVKQNLKDMIIGDKKDLIKACGSGSTGIQGEVWLNKEAYSTTRAINTVIWGWSGYRIGDSIFQNGVSNHDLFKQIKDFLFRTRYVHAFGLDEDLILKELHELQKSPRGFFFGYSSSIYLYAKLAEESGIDNIRFKAVQSFGEKLFPHYRETIERVFQTKVYDSYGAAEGYIVSGQCSEGNNHIITPHLHIDVVDELGNPRRPGELGFVVLTRLDRTPHPLIRYYVGDLAALHPLDKVCPCGRPYPLLKEVIGRDTDIIRTRSGKRLLVHQFTGLFEFIPEIKQFKVIQRELGHIEIHFIRSDGFTQAVLDHVQQTIDSQIKEHLPIKFFETDFLAPAPSGKFQVIKSYLPKTISESSKPVYHQSSE